MACCLTCKSNENYPLSALNAKLNYVLPRLSADQILKLFASVVRSIPWAVLVVVRSVSRAAVVVQSGTVAGVRSVPFFGAVPGAVVGAQVAQSADLKPPWIPLLPFLPFLPFQSYQ